MESSLSRRETLPNFIRRSLEAPREAAVLERVGDRWEPTSASRLLARTENTACAIREAGLDEGDRVVLIASDCVDWIVADFGILFAGCVVVPIYPTQAAEHVRYIIESSQAKLIFTDTFEAAKRIAALAPGMPRIVVFEDASAEGFKAFERTGATARGRQPNLPSTYEDRLTPDALAVLIYTSGTTGEPKGVMLSHDNITFNAISSFTRAFDLPAGSDALSVLPFSHIYEHTVIYGYLFKRLRHHISHSADELARDLKDVRPVIMTAVPRIFERVIAAISSRAKLAAWALKVGREYMSQRTRSRGAPAFWLAVKFAIANALILRKIRPLLGLDRVRFLVSGSAPLHFDVAMTMLALGVPIVEGYGPTECSPVISVNTLAENRYGTVGKPIPGMEVRIADDGEILTRGRSVMLGYYKDEMATAQALEGGWYHTGDIGTMDSDGYLRITDRKNESFKTSGGKWIAPARVEASIKRSIFVNQAMVTGAARPHPIALISPNWDLVRLERTEAHAFLQREVRKQTADLAPHEHVRNIVVLPRELTIEAGELSPSLKMKRRAIEQRYAGQIDRAYSQASYAQS